MTTTNTELPIAEARARFKEKATAAMDLGTAIHEAIANADAQLNNVALPNYTTLLAQRDALVAALKAFDNRYVRDIPTDHKDYALVMSARAALKLTGAA